MKIGKIVSAELTRAEQYGLFFLHEQSQIFIQIPEIDWVKKIPSAVEYAPLGTIYDVLILAFNSDKNLFYGSIKQARPEDDPWNKINEYPVGSIHTAKPLMNTDYGTFVELIPGLDALLYNPNGGNLELCEEIKVSIKSHDSSRRKIEVEIPT